MKQEYDFSNGERRKFHRPDLISPVHLELQVLAYLAERAKAKGIPLDELVNSLLKKDIALIETGK